MDYLRERFQGPLPNEERTWRDEMSVEFKECCPSLSYEHRLYGFGICILLGAILSFLSTLFLTTLKFEAFAIVYSLGSFFGLCSTLFLVGPFRQIQMMFTKNRYIATSIYLLLIIATLFIGLYRKGDKDFLTNAQRIILILILVLCQFVAAIWYSLSYIPYARKVIKKTIGPFFECIC